MSLFFMAMDLCCLCSADLPFTIRAVSAQGRLAAWAREVQAAAPGWEFATGPTKSPTTK